MGGRARASISIAVALVIAMATAASSARAVTEVSGDQDSNAALIIDPSTDPTDAFTKELTLASATVEFIQKMPVTKVVDEVTIGDIGQATSCTTPSRTRLYIREHTGDPDLGSDFHTSLQIASSTGYVSLPSAPSKVTYAIPPTTFRMGRGYSFVISADYSGTDCKSARQTTWAHDGAQVNAGPATCIGAPTNRRMWHAYGVDDAQSPCVSRGEPGRIFKPDMPTGWLVSRASGAHWDIMGGSHLSGDPIPSDACSASTGGDPLALGAYPVFWRFRPNSGGTISEYVCLWSQFADHGDTIDDGWYYAQPWLVERGGAPRDMYLKLDTIDYDDLLETYTPVLAFDADENFYPQEAGSFTDFADPPSGGYLLSSEYVNILYDEDGEELAAAGSPGPGNGPWPPVMVLGTLGDRYWFGPDPEDQPEAVSTDYIDARGSSESTYSADSMAQYTAGYDDVIYGRVVHDPDDGQLWLQYWFFYYFNSFDVLGVGYHEGDWEMVQVGLDGSFAAEEMTFAAHDGAYGLDWDDVVKDGVGSTKPVVYVAARSHASYPEPGETEVIWMLATDHHQGDGIEKASMPIEEIDSSTRWTHWPGRWGSSLGGSTPSPKTPMEQGDKWSEPSAFHDAADDW